MKRVVQLVALAAWIAGCAHHSAGVGRSAGEGFSTSPPPQGTLTTPPPAKRAPNSAPAPPPPTTTPPAEPTPSDEPRPNIVTDSMGVPKFGDYVYVEELPEAVARVAPVYPEAARAAGVSGVVQLQALVKTDGTVGEVRVVKSIPPLDAAAIACVKQWRFKPALTAGKPVAVWIGIPVHFSGP